MRFVLGLLTGAALAAGAVMWLPIASPDDRLAIVSDVGTGGVAQLATPPSTEQSARTAATSESIWPRFFGMSVPAREAERQVVAHDSAAAASSSRTAWATQVVAPQPVPAVRPTSTAMQVVPAVVTPIASVSLPRDVPRYELVRDLQRELKRVGCYAGEVDGQWGPGTRRGIQSFMDRVNSALPSDEPDLIQLTLVRGYSGAACAAGRPAVTYGTVTAAERSIVPPMPVAAVAPLPLRDVPRAPSAPAVGGETVAVAPVLAPASVVPLEGRMSVGGPPVPGLEGQQPVAVPDPALDALAKSAQRSKVQSRPVTQRRSDRSWTGSFFNN